MRLSSAPALRRRTASWSAMPSGIWKLRRGRASEPPSCAPARDVKPKPWFVARKSRYTMIFPSSHGSSWEAPTRRLSNTVMTIPKVFEEHATVVARAAQELPPILARVVTALDDCLRGGHKVLACGNGGSAADSQHLVAELVGRFVVERR